jgi:hypothetical protein
MGTTDTTDLLTSTEAAALVHLTSSGFRRLARGGRIRPALTLPSGAMLFHRSDVEDLATEREA